MYSQANFLLLDDPIAALDHVTAEKVMRKCFSEKNAILKGRAVILTTHRTDLVHHFAGQFVNVSNGKVSVLREDPFVQPDILGYDETNSEVIQEQPCVRADTDNGIAPQHFIEDEKKEHGGIQFGIFKIFVKAGEFLVGRFVRDVDIDKISWSRRTVVL